MKFLSLFTFYRAPCANTIPNRTRQKRERKKITPRFTTAAGQGRRLTSTFMLWIITSVHSLPKSSSRALYTRQPGYKTGSPSACFFLSCVFCLLVLSGRRCIHQQRARNTAHSHSLAVVASSAQTPVQFHVLLEALAPPYHTRMITRSSM